MKKLLIILFSVAITLGASAQKYGHRPGGGVHYIRPRVSVGIGLGALGMPYGYYGNPYFYSPFYEPYYRSGRPTKLDLQIEGIKKDYEQKIWGAQHDDKLSRKERKRTVHELKMEKDKAVIEAKKNYYKY